MTESQCRVHLTRLLFIVCENNDWLSHYGIWAIIPCSPYMVCVRVRKLAEIFFAKDRTAPEANRLNSFLRILEMQFHRKKKDKNKQKSHKSLFESLSKNTWKHTELKYLHQLRKKTKVLFLHDREAIRRSSHSPIDITAACLSDIKNINHK